MMIVPWSKLGEIAMPEEEEKFYHWTKDGS